MISKVSIIGTGTREDPYRPSWDAPDWSAVIPSDSLGHPLTSDCIAWTRALSVRGAKALSTEEALSELTRRSPKANQKLINSVSPLGILLPSLFAATKTPVSRRVVMAAAVGLGIAFLLPRRAFAARVTVFSDNFNRADGALGANWQGSYSTHADLAIAANLCRTSIVSSEESDGTHVNALAADQWAQYTIASWGGSSNCRIPYLIVRSAASPTQTWYQAEQLWGCSGNSVITKKIAAATTVLASEASTIWGIGDVALLEVQGTGLTLSRNGSSVLTATDSDIAGSGCAGLGIYCAASASDAEIDGFSAGEYGAAGVDAISLPLLGVG